MQEIRKAPLRWLIVAGILIVLSIGVLTASIVSNNVRNSQRDQQKLIAIQVAEVKSLRAQLAAAKRLDSDRVYAACIAGLQASAKATVVINAVRDVLDGLAATTADQLDRDRTEGASTERIVQRQQSLDRWRRLRSQLPEFATPACTRGINP